MFQVMSQIDSLIARGMQFSVLCGEDIPFITDDEVKRTSENSFYGDARVRPTRRICAEWPRAAIAPTLIVLVESFLPKTLGKSNLRSDEREKNSEGSRFRGARPD
jgi:hypothetical protein